MHRYPGAKAGMGAPPWLRGRRRVWAQVAVAAGAAVGGAMLRAPLGVAAVAGVAGAAVWALGRRPRRVALTAPGAGDDETLLVTVLGRLAGDPTFRRDLWAALEAAETEGPDLLERTVNRDRFAFEVAARLATAEPDTCAIVVFWLEELERLQSLAPATADAALSAFAERLAAAVSSTQPIGRLQGGAFAVLLQDPDGAEAIARQVKALSFVLAQEIAVGETGFTPEIRTGVALLHSAGQGADDLLLSAEASARGAIEATAGEGVSVFSEAKRQAALDRFTLKQELRSAIEREELTLQYQPVVDLAAGQVVAAEALLRWRRPDGVLVPPDRFVPLLEAGALVEDVGLWILNSACRQLRTWAEAGLPRLRVAVNLSARQFRDPSLADVIARMLELHGVEPDALEVELTETAAMQDVARSRAVLGELKALGVGVAIDDFGSGYSNMSYLRTLPFSKLKIDREFVSEVDRRPASRAICKAVIELASGLGMSVLAEGVERIEEVNVLLGLGCATFQGFYFSRPVDPDVLSDLVADSGWLARLAAPAQRRISELQRLST
jgi:EAL domain-containing protein (putative c-di-GMP-specific phosphodiesterase class I)/GGDEF domain-containing protein